MHGVEEIHNLLRRVQGAQSERTAQLTDEPSDDRNAPRVSHQSVSGVGMSRGPSELFRRTAGSVPDGEAEHVLFLFDGRQPQDIVLVHQEVLGSVLIGGEPIAVRHPPFQVLRVAGVNPCRLVSRLGPWACCGEGGKWP